MTRLAWGAVGERFYEIGVDRGVLYPNGGTGVSWNGLISVDETPSGGEAQPFYIDGFKYQNRSAPEEYEATIEAYTYPTEFEECDGTKSLGLGLFIDQQPRVPFGLCYRTRIGNDLDGTDHGYKLHLVYNALVSPTNKNYVSMNANPEAMTFSWPITTRPISVSGHRAIMHMVLDSTKVSPPLLITLEDILYGSDSASARLPSPSEIITLFSGWPTLYVVDNGDGTFTLSGPDDVVSLIDANTFQVSADSVVNNGDGSFDVTSY